MTVQPTRFIAWVDPQPFAASVDLEGDGDFGSRMRIRIRQGVTEDEDVIGSAHAPDEMIDEAIRLAIDN